MKEIIERLTQWMQKPWLVLAGVLLLGFALLLPGLGANGLADPWEMRMAHSARGMNSLPVLQVLEQASVDSKGGQDFPVSTRLQDAFDQKVQVVGPHQLKKGASSRAVKQNRKTLLLQGKRFRKSRVVHAIAIDVGLWMPPGQEKQDLEGLLKEVAEISNALWQVPIVLFSKDNTASLETLRGQLEQRWAVESKDNGKLIPMPVLASGMDGKELLDAFAFLPGAAASRAWFLHDGELETQPFFETWLTARSFDWFGVSELSARLPSALFALATLLLVFGIGAVLWGTAVGGLAAAILATMPIFILQGRMASGDMAYTFFLLLSLVGFTLTLKWRNRPYGWLTLLAGWTGLFLSVGLFGLLLSVLVIVSYGLVTLDRRVAGPAMVGLSLLGALSALVLVPEEWTFFSHFTFMQSLFTDQRPDEVIHFDVVLKQIGFGCFPWIALLPFAYSDLFPGAGAKGREHADRARRIWLLLFISVPLMLTMFSLADFGHLFFPALPAIALALALFLQRQWKGERMGSGAAFLLLMVLAIVWRELRKSASPLFHGVMMDPAFSEQKGGVSFPAEVELGAWFAVLGGLSLLLISVYHGRWLGLGRQVLSAFRRGRLLHWSMAFSIILLGLQAVLGLLVRYAEAMNTAPGKQLAEADRFFPVHLLQRPEHVVALALIVLLVLGALFRETPVHVWLKDTRFNKWFSNIRERLSGIQVAPWNSLSTFSWAAVVLGILAMVDVFLRLPFPDGFGVGTTFADPGIWALATLVLFIVLPLNLPEGILTRPLIRLREKRGPWTRIVGGSLFLYVALRLSKEVWFVPLELWAPAALFGLFSVPHLMRWCAGREGRWVLLSAVILLGWAGSMLVPFLHKWNEVGPRIYSSDHNWLVVAGFAKTRLTLVGYGLVLFFGLNGLWGHRNSIINILGDSENRGQWFGLTGILLIAGLISGLTFTPVGGGVVAVLSIALVSLVLLSGGLKRVLDKVVPGLRSLATGVESGPFVLVATGLLALLITFGVSRDLSPALAVHVSQKHVVATHAQASEREAGELFRYGSFGNGGADFNFYTQQVPAAKDVSQVMELLTGQKDVLLMGEEGILEAPRLIAGWDPDNDPDGDGKRDWKAWGGVAERGANGEIKAPGADWETDEWVGSVFVNAAGRTYSVTSNTTDSLTVEGNPDIPERPGDRSRFTLDHRDAPNHQATAMEKSRSFFLLERKSFSRLNHRFRKKMKGAHITVLDNSSSQLILATGREVEGEESVNEIQKQTLTEEQFSQEKDVQPVYVNLSDTLEIIGYRTVKRQYKRKEKLQLDLFYRVKKRLNKEYKVFMHIEKSGTTHRIHGDHFVMNNSPDGKHKKCVGCYDNKHWMKGDIIVDSYEREVPSSTPSGVQEVWMGFYNPRDQKRLKVKDFDKEVVRHDGKNRVLVGTFRVR